MKDPGLDQSLDGEVSRVLSPVLKGEEVLVGIHDLVFQ